MPTVAINAPKTPVTKGSNGIAMATLPNVCKMPGPPPPFVPTPLPNIGQSSKLPMGYSTTVKIEGQPVAIQGASFGSSGDIASKASGGGVISANAEGPTKFIGPGSLDVKIEGKNVQLLGDPTLNNCGPAGTPANSATMAGVLQGILSPELQGHAAALKVGVEVQEICNIHCECTAEGDNTQLCIDRELFRKDRQSGFTRRTKSEVPYDMSVEPPTPYMSQNDPRRQTRQWCRLGSRRPDAVVVRDPSKPWTCDPEGEDNIAAVIECKWGTDTPGKGQLKAYERIAGGGEKLVLMDDSNCTCPEDNRKKRLPVPLPAKERARQIRPEPGGDLSPSWVRPLANAVAALSVVAAAAAVAASLPAVASAAAAVALLGLLGSGSSTSGGGEDVI